MGGTGDGSARAVPELKKNPSLLKRNFQLTVPVISFFKLRKHQPLFYVNKPHSCILLKSTIFSLWVITQAHPGRSRIQWKNEEKKNNRVAMTQPSVSPSQQGWPPRHHGKHSPAPELPGLCSTVTKRSSISWQSPSSDLLSWVQSGFSSFSYHNDISLRCARHFGLCTIFPQGSVKKYFTRRITLSWIWFERFSK